MVETMNLTPVVPPAQGISLAKALRARLPGKATSPNLATKNPAETVYQTLLPASGAPTAKQD